MDKSDFVALHFIVPYWDSGKISKKLRLFDFLRTTNYEWYEEYDVHETVNTAMNMYNLLKFLTMNQTIELVFKTHSNTIRKKYIYRKQINQIGENKCACTLT